jgi:hypothetical protein
MATPITATETQRAIYATFSTLHYTDKVNQFSAVIATTKTHKVSPEDVVDACDQVCFVDGIGSVDWDKDVYALLPEEAN